jgi:hypothetical protein
MKTLKVGIVLLALMLGGLVIVPMVNAAEPAADSLTSDSAVSTDYQYHNIPYNYPGNSKHADFLPESKMTNIILSQKTLKNLGQDSKSALIKIPVSNLNLNSGFTKTTGSTTYSVEKGINSNDGIVLIRMPTLLYNQFMEDAQGGDLTLASTHFCRFYSNFNDLNSHVKKDNESVQITSSSQYPVPGLLDDGYNPAPAQETPSKTVSPLSQITPRLIEGALSTSSDYGSYLRWATSTKKTSTNYKYCIGQIRPYSWSLGGSASDLFKLYAEREYKFNNNEAIEIVARFHDRNGGGGIDLYPAYYRSGAADPINNNQWYYWHDPIGIDQNGIPHAFGYHVQLTYSGQYVQVSFIDMVTLRWYDAYLVHAATPITSFTQLDGSSEYTQINAPSTGTFSEVTNPVIDEWAIDTGNNWAKPITVWNTPTLSPNRPHVNVSPSWDSYGNLITVSTANYP